MGKTASYSSRPTVKKSGTKDAVQKKGFKKHLNKKSIKHQRQGESAEAGGGGKMDVGRGDKKKYTEKKQKTDSTEEGKSSNSFSKKRKFDQFSNKNNKQKKYNKKSDKNKRKEEEEERDDKELNCMSISQQRKLKKRQTLLKRDPKYDFIRQTNLLYNRLLMGHKNGTSKKSSAIVDELLEHLNENLSVMCKNMCVSRAMQACLKYGNQQQRNLIWQRLLPLLSALAMEKYTHNLVIKLFLYGDKNMKEQTRKTLIQSSDIFFSKFGSIVWEYVYTSEMIPSSKQRDMIYALIIPNIVIVKVPNALEYKNILDIYNALDENTKKILKNNLAEMIQKAVDKELLDKAAVHTILKYYTLCCTDEEKSECFSRVEEGCIHLITTKDGVEALSRMLGYVNAKQRKKFLKSIKQKICELSCNVVDYLLICRLLNIMDDTKALNELIIKEMSGQLQNICFDKYGHKVIFQALSDINLHRYFNDYENSIMHLPSPASLKDAGRRREELQSYMIKHLQNLFLNCQNVAEWIIHPWAKNILIEYLALTADATVVDRTINEVQAELNDGKDELLIDHQIGHRTIESLLKLQVKRRESTANKERKETDEEEEEEEEEEKEKEKEEEEEEERKQQDDDAEKLPNGCAAGEEAHGLCGSNGEKFICLLWKCIKSKLNKLLKTRAIFLIIDILKLSREMDVSSHSAFKHEVEKCCNKEAINNAKHQVEQQGGKIKGFDLLLEALEGRS